MRFLIIFTLFFSTTCFGQLSKSDQLLINDICEKYATCTSYQDSGFLKNTLTILESGNLSTRTGDFTTMFLRDEGFKLSFNSYSNRDTSLLFRKVILHQDMDSTLSTYYSKFYKGEPKIKKQFFLFSMAALSGGSHDAGRFAPSLLLPGKAFGLSNYQGEDCYKFKLSYEFDRNKGLKFFSQFVDIVKPKESLDEPHMVQFEEISWISKKDFLLKKIEKTQSSKESISKTVVTYQSKMNEDIESKLLELNLPK